MTKTTRRQDKRKSAALEADNADASDHGVSAGTSSGIRDIVSLVFNKPNVNTGTSKKPREGQDFKPASESTIPTVTQPSFISPVNESITTFSSSEDEVAVVDRKDVALSEFSGLSKKKGLKTSTLVTPMKMPPGNPPRRTVQSHASVAASSKIDGNTPNKFHYIHTNTAECLFWVSQGGQPHKSAYTYTAEQKVEQNASIKQNFGLWNYVNRRTNYDGEKPLSNGRNTYPWKVGLYIHDDCSKNTAKWTSGWVNNWCKLYNYWGTGPNKIFKWDNVFEVEVPPPYDVEKIYLGDYIMTLDVFNVMRAVSHNYQNADGSNYTVRQMLMDDDIVEAYFGAAKKGNARAIFNNTFGETEGKIPNVDEAADYGDPRNFIQGFYEL